MNVLFQDILDFVNGVPSEAAMRDRLFQRVFQFQIENVPAYRNFCERRGFISNGNGPSWSEKDFSVPFLPTSAFKWNRIAAFPQEKTVARFHTSGTSMQRKGVHEYSTLDLYENSCLRSFELLVSDAPTKCIYISLIPSRFDAPRSSLSHMVDLLPRRLRALESVSAHTDSGLNLNLLREILTKASKQSIPVFLSSTSSALSDCLEALKSERFALPLGSMIFETGGRKLKRKVLSPFECATEVEKILGIPKSKYRAEYGMTELSTPAWGKLEGETVSYTFPFWCPWWILDPTTLKPSPSEGLLAVFDLANADSVSALMVGDWVRKTEGGFAVEGRALSHEWRGCSLGFKEPTPND